MLRNTTKNGDIFLSDFFRQIAASLLLAAEKYSLGNSSERPSGVWCGVIVVWCGVVWCDFWRVILVHYQTYEYYGWDGVWSGWW